MAKRKKKTKRLSELQAKRWKKPKPRRAKAPDPPLHISDCLHVKKQIHLAGCGLIFTKFMLEQADVRPDDTMRVRAGVGSAKGVLDQMVYNVKDELQPQAKKAKAAATKALNLIKKDQPVPTGASLDRLKKAVSKAFDAHKNFEEAADELCRKGRE